ncbi:uncharacterized, partial [Tachysurus ichikawai]
MKQQQHQAGLTSAATSDKTYLIKLEAICSSGQNTGCWRKTGQNVPDFKSIFLNLVKMEPTVWCKTS